MSLFSFSGLALLSSRPKRTKSTSWRNSSFVSGIGVARIGSTRASTGSIGPIGAVRSLFCDGQSKHIECDWPTVASLWKDLPKQLSVFGHVVNSSQHLVANVEVIARKGEPRDFHPFCRRNESLRHQQLPLVR